MSPRLQLAAVTSEVDVTAQTVTAQTGVMSQTGAAPVWDITTRTLVWVERDGETVHRFDPATGSDEPLGLPQPVAAACPRRGGGLVLALRDGVALLDPGGTRRWLVYWAREGVAGAAATVDRTGRLWVATSGDGTLLRVEPDGELCVVAQGRDISSIAFSPDGATMYLAGAATEQVTAADFDPDSGQVGPDHPVCPVPGGAHALCVDAEGRLWVAPTTGTAVHRHHPDGTLDRHLPVGASPTGCAFGGSGFSELYITTAPPRTDPAGPLLMVPDTGTGLPLPVFAG